MTTRYLYTERILMVDDKHRLKFKDMQNLYIKLPIFRLSFINFANRKEINVF